MLHKWWSWCWHTCKFREGPGFQLGSKTVDYIPTRHSERYMTPGPTQPPPNPMPTTSPPASVQTGRKNPAETLEGKIPARSLLSTGSFLSICSGPQTQQKPGVCKTSSSLLRKMPGGKELLLKPPGCARTEIAMPQDRSQANAQGTIAEVSASQQGRAVRVGGPGNDMVAQEGGRGRTGQQGSAGKDTTSLGTECARALKKEGAWLLRG